jgi:hypothetical protein
VALVLVQHLHEPLAAGQLALSIGIELRPELRERLEVAVLRQVQTRDTEMPTLIAGRTPE